MTSEAGSQIEVVTVSTSSISHSEPSSSRRRRARTPLSASVLTPGVATALLLAVACAKQPEPAATSVGGVSVRADGDLVLRTMAAEFVLRPSGYVEAARLSREGRLGLDDPGDAPGFGLVVDGVERRDIRFDLRGARIEGATGPGGGVRVEAPARGLAPPDLDVTLVLEATSADPSLLAVTVTILNRGRKPVRLDRLRVLERRLSAARVHASNASHDLWSFHGSSETPGRDAVVRLAPGFGRSNVVGGAVARGYGGGIPVVAFWSARGGQALGQLSAAPAALSLPVAVGEGYVRAGLVLEPGVRLSPSESYSSPRLFLATFAGDYYDALRTYAATLEREGLLRHEPAPGSYEAAWSSWGFGRRVTPRQVERVIPKLKSLGIRWAVLDDGWFDAVGDWQPREPPYDEATLRGLVAAYHAAGLRLKLWWVPLGVEAGTLDPRFPQEVAAVSRRHPEWLALAADGRPAAMTRGLGTLCPALPEVRAYHRRLVERFLGEWGFDGLKLDAVYSAPQCHNPRHGHRSPDDSVEALGTLYREIYRTARAVRPDAVVQICSCATLPNVAWLGAMNQAVTADPSGSAQNRRRIKVYKALLGPRAAVFGDHVELTHAPKQGGRERLLGRDFASTIGLGGVPGTRFTWPAPALPWVDALLEPHEEEHWGRWLRLYDETRLAEGEFRNLYVHGYDVPEAYAVERQGRMYYAFFAPKPAETWQGVVELRGLAPGRHRVRDYVRDRALDVVEGPIGRLSVAFADHLLLESWPVAY